MVQGSEEKEKGGVAEHENWEEDPGGSLFSFLFFLSLFSFFVYINFIHHSTFIIQSVQCVG